MRKGLHYHRDNYFELCCYFNLMPLNIRRQILDLCFVHKCVNFLADCPDITSKLNFYVPPRRLRSSDLFRIPNHRVNLSKYSFLSRAMNLLNRVNHFDVDLFSSFCVFKTQVSNVLLFLADKPVIVDCMWCQSVGRSVCFLIFCVFSLYLFSF